MNFREKAIKECRYIISEKFQEIRDLQSEINALEIEIGWIRGD